MNSNVRAGSSPASSTILFPRIIFYTWEYFFVYIKRNKSHNNKLFSNDYDEELNLPTVYIALTFYRTFCSNLYD